MSVMDFFNTIIRPPSELPQAPYQQQDQQAAGASFSNIQIQSPPVQRQAPIMSTMPISNLPYTPTPQFTDVESKQAIERGIAAAQLTPTLRDDWYWQNQQRKFGQNIMHATDEYRTFAMERNLVVPISPISAASDAALRQQQLMSGLTGKNVTQLPEFRDYGQFRPAQIPPEQILPGFGKGTPAYQSYYNLSAETAPRLPVLQGPALMGEPLDASRFTPMAERGDYGLPKPFISQPTTTTIQKPTGLFAFFQQPIETTTVLKNVPGGTTTTTTITPLPSGYETFERGISEQYVKPILPESSKGVFETYSRIALPLATIPGDIDAGAVSLVTGKKQPTPAETLGGFFYGSYQGIREKPVTTVAAIGAGTVLGVGFKALEYGGVVGAEAASTQFPGATSALTTLNVNILPKVLMGAYAADVGIRSTKGLTEFEPTKVSQRFGRIMSTEAIPMGIGFGIGHEAPGAIYRQARMQEIDIKAFQQETGGGAFEYAKASSQAAVDIGMKPIRAAQIDYGSFVQEGRGGLPDYLSYKIQKPIMETEFKAALFFEKIGRPDLRAAPKEIFPTRTTEPFTSVPESRIGAKVVGGKTVAGLRSEPSLKSMGIFEEIPKGSPTKLYGGKFGEPSKTMKPMDFSQAKQSAIAIQIFKTEQLPGMEPMAASARTPAISEFRFAPMTLPRARTQATVQIIEPEFALKQRKEIGVAFAQEFAQMPKQRQREPMMMSMEVLKGQRQRQIQEERQRFSTERPFRLLSESSQRDRFIQETFSGTRQRYRLITEPASRIIQQQKSESQQRIEPKQAVEQFTRLTKIPEITPAPFGGFGWPAGSDIAPKHGRGKSPFRETIGIKSLFASITAVGKGTRQKKKYVEVGKEYATTVGGKKTTVRHKRKTGR